MARRATLHDVELVDDDSDDGTGAPPPTDGSTTAAAPRRRWPLVLGAAVLAVLVVVGVTGQVLQDRRERARLAAVAASPQSVPLLDGPPVPRWETHSETFYEATQVRTPEGLLVGLRSAVEGPVAAAALDVATGREVWRVELVDGSTRPAVDPGFEAYPDSGYCTAHGDRADLAVCLAHDGARVIGRESAGYVAPTTSRLVVLDTRDGTVVTDLTASLEPGTHPTSVATLGDLVVAVVEASDGTTVRASTTDGTARWSVPVTTTADPEAGGTRVERVGDLVAVLGETEVVLLDEDGATVRTHPLAGGYAYSADGGVHVRPRSQAADAPTTIVRQDGVVEVRGDVLTPLVDDGSAPGLALTSDGRHLVAWVDGEQSWTADDPGWWNLLVLGGRVVVDDGGGLTALDARDGTRAWRSEVVRGLPVTDGRVLLGVARVAERGEQAQMVALDPADGTELWRAPLPDGTTELVAWRHLLLAGRDDGHETHLTVLG
ncbi:hypothetical protein Cfla_0062 [Cellulomonas flavigena DSM 20109]|uniref:Pyrrolo-quinoline quinone repeat domain-containing protein n=1 Tax=Cellulomonas flavigena (strain ATCC 482 / DSM 20109 / BCRC 11376 / JCM 18109 / NBRC 3775 / NCIMB 8073 / NRS 134) TaxID=446466 RepID=D5UFM3_CELFN|nr:PQQ-binding-like beta-propeller repeat protein [Cellulomonas flavigena]ADG72982.1 hypothetical protein Cfla_0062 [Cellulomonas flavigena DSM 20109]